MEFVLPVMWINYGIVFPQSAMVEGSRGHVLAQLLAQAMPEQVDAIATLNRFSDSHIQVSQRAQRRGSAKADGYPCHVFTYSAERWNNMHAYLNDLVTRKVVYSSNSILAQRKLEGAKAVMVPPGATPEEIAKKIAEASAATTTAAAAPDTAPAPPAVLPVETAPPAAVPPPSDK